MELLPKNSVIPINPGKPPVFDLSDSDSQVCQSEKYQALKSKLVEAGEYNQRAVIRM